MSSVENKIFSDSNFVKAFATLFAVFVIIYLSVLTNYSISVDDERAAWRTDSVVWIRQGRWGIYLIEQYIFPHAVVPLFPQLLFGISATIGFLFLCEIFREPSKSVFTAASFGLFISTPTWYFILEFYANTIATGIGFTLTTFAALQSNNIKYNSTRRSIFKQTIVGVLSLSLAISLYQSYILLYICIAAGILLQLILFESKNARYGLKKLKNFLFTFALSLATYYFIWKIFLSVKDVQPAYVDSFFNPKIALNSPLEVITSALNEVVKIYLGSVGVFAQNAWSYKIFSALAFSAVLYALWRKGPIYILLGLPLLMCVVLAPFALNIVAGSAVPYRSLVGVPFGVWFLAVCVHRLSSTPTTKNAVLALTLVVLAQNCYSIAIFDANTRLVATHDQLLAEQVYQRILHVSKPLKEGKKQAVEFFGAAEFTPPYPRVTSSTAGYSFFEWDGGNPARMISFLHLLGHKDLTEIKLDVRTKLRPEFESMPSWPAQGSVRLSGDVVLIKMGESPGLVHADLVSDVRSPLFDTTKQGFSGMQLVNAQVLSSTASLNVRTGVDPQIYIDIGPSAHDCRSLQVNLHMDVPTEEMSQVFYLPAGVDEYSESNSVVRKISPSDHTVTYYVRSATGFNPRLRLDPTWGPRDIVINRIAVGCAG